MSNRYDITAGGASIVANNMCVSSLMCEITKGASIEDKNVNGPKYRNLLVEPQL